MFVITPDIMKLRQIILLSLHMRRLHHIYLSINLYISEEDGKFNYPCICNFFRFVNNKKEFTGDIAGVQA